jgi:hypothetical protein
MTGAMANMKELDQVDREFAAQDKQWGGGKFIGLGLLTLFVAVFIIISAAVRSGCSLVIVP